jgi:translation elongation factor EF-G
LPHLGGGVKIAKVDVLVVGSGFTGCVMTERYASEGQGTWSFTMQLHHYDLVLRNVAEEIMAKSA